MIHWVANDYVKWMKFTRTQVTRIRPDQASIDWNCIRQSSCTFIELNEKKIVSMNHSERQIFKLLLVLIKLLNWTLFFRWVRNKCVNQFYNLNILIYIVFYWRLNEVAEFISVSLGINKYCGCVFTCEFLVNKEPLAIAVLL